MIPAVWDRLLRLPTGFFARFSSGDLAFRAMEFSKVFKKMSGATVTTLMMGLFAIFNLGLLFFYSWKMALCTTLLLGIMLAVTGVLLAGLLRYETSIHRIDGVISGLLLELLGGIITLRTAVRSDVRFRGGPARYTERLVLSIQGQAVCEPAAPVAGGLSDSHGDGRLCRSALRGHGAAQDREFPGVFDRVLRT